MAVKKGLAGDGFKIGYHAPILSLLEGIVARGDERAGRLVLDAYRRGARLDAWEEHVRLDIWRSDRGGRVGRPGRNLPGPGAVGEAALGGHRPGDFLQRDSDAPQRIRPHAVRCEPAPVAAQLARLIPPTSAQARGSSSASRRRGPLLHLPPGSHDGLREGPCRAGLRGAIHRRLQPEAAAGVRQSAEPRPGFREEIAGIDLYDYDTEGRSSGR